jgi:hypothetical protein
MTTTAKISAGARKLYDFIPPVCWMTRETLAKGIGCRVTKIKDYKDELEEARLVKLLFHRNGKRSNPRHEIIKLSNSGTPICKHISKGFCIDEWSWLDRNSLIECYLKSNWNVLPFEPREKRPVVGFSTSDWKSKSESTKMDYFFNNPNVNVGLVVCPHITVIDAETKNNIWTENEKFRDTLTVSTPRGYHFYFRNDSVIKTSTKILPDIDTRCAGSYVVLPPSIHPSGKQYEWETISAPELLPVSFRQKWRIANFEKSKSTGSFACPELILKGNRNDTLWRFGRSLRSQGKNFYETEQEIIEANRNKCSVPLPATEIEQLINHIWNYRDR